MPLGASITNDQYQHHFWAHLHTKHCSVMLLQHFLMEYSVVKSNGKLN